MVWTQHHSVAGCGELGARLGRGQEDRSNPKKRSSLKKRFSPQKRSSQKNRFSQREWRQAMKARYFLICSLITLCAAVASLMVVSHLPNVVPSHWDLHRNVDGYSSRGFLAPLLPALLAAITLLFPPLPVLSPRTSGVESFPSPPFSS